MPDSDLHKEELDYLIRYAHMAPVYFSPLRDAAEKIAGKDGSESEIQQITLNLISDMIDQGIRVGDMSAKDGEGVIPWDVPKDDTLRRVADEMRQHQDPVDFIDICWFSAI